VRGYDAGKKIKGRKRHLIVDILGLPLEVKVHSADIQDREGAKLVLKNLKQSFPWLKVIFGDGGYAGDLERWVFENLRCKLEIVKRGHNVSSFKVLPKRWVVERTFAWLDKSRRLAKDWEYLLSTSESLIKFSLISLMQRRLALKQNKL
jgi:putative transposase